MLARAIRERDLHLHDCGVCLVKVDVLSLQISFSDPSCFVLLPSASRFILRPSGLGGFWPLNGIFGRSGIFSSRACWVAIRHGANTLLGGQRWCAEHPCAAGSRPLLDPAAHGCSTYYRCPPRIALVFAPKHTCNSHPARPAIEYFQMVLDGDYGHRVHLCFEIAAEIPRRSHQRLAAACCARSAESGVGTQTVNE